MEALDFHAHHPHHGKKKSSAAEIHAQDSSGTLLPIPYPGCISMKQSTPLLFLALIAVAVSLSFIHPAPTSAAGVNPASAADASAIEANPVKLDRLDPSIDRIIPTGAKIERIAKGFTWVEGPVWVKDRLFFAEIPSNSIRTWTPGKGTSIFLQPSGYKGTAAYGGPESGSN